MTQHTGMLMHIDENLGARRRNFVENILERRRGIHGARFSKEHPHLVVVEYDPRIIDSLDILRHCLYQNLGVERVA